MIIIVRGVSGCGKTTIGQILARDLGYFFIDADNYHPVKNRCKLLRGIALDDADREPWLMAVKEIVKKHQKQDRSAVLACSALKQVYRKLLGCDQAEVKSILLNGPFNIIKQRLHERDHEFMNSGLLQSQFDTLEFCPQERQFDIRIPPETIVKKIIFDLKLQSLT